MSVFTKLKSYSLAGLLVVLSLGLHSNALFPQTTHAMRGMNHGASPSSSCITVCTSATLQKEDYLAESENNDDDEPDAPYYTQFQLSSLVSLEKKHSKEAHFVMKKDPPPGGPPAYIALAVFRA